MNFNEEKLAKLKRADALFEERYGKSGSKSRADFESKAMAWYYGEILKDKRKELKITQKQLAEQTGMKREYISLLERGETDMQLSTFFNLSHALGLRVSVA